MATSSQERARTVRLQPQRGRVSSNGKYPEPEGWGDDGFWRDTSIDSDYETGHSSAVRPSAAGRPALGNGGYSYWADGKGWANSPGTATRGGGAGGAGGARAARGGTSTRVDSFAARAGRRARGYGASSPTAAYGAGYGPGYGAPGTGPYREGGMGPSGPGGPGRHGRGAGGSGGHGGRGRGKVKGSWWRHWSWKKALGVAGAMFAAFILLLVIAYFYAYN